MSTPMGRDEVLAVLDEWGELHKARSAVAALYVKNAQLEAQLQERISELFAMELERDALRLALERIAAYNDTGAFVALNDSGKRLRECCNTLDNLTIPAAPQSAPKAAEPVEPQARHWFDPARMPSERDGDGYISHPDADLRIWFNGEPKDEAPLDPERFAELGLEVKFCTEEIEYADDDNHMENPLNPPEKWDGDRPPGEGWRLGGTYPTEGGHAAFWVRSRIAAVLANGGEEG